MQLRKCANIYLSSFYPYWNFIKYKKAPRMYSHMLSKQFLKHTFVAFFSIVLGRKAHKKNFL